MFSLRSTYLSAAATVVALLGTAAVAQAAPPVLSTEKAPTTVAAYAGIVMWSQLDQATGDYKLVKSVEGAPPVAVGVPERDAPFDIDLGTNRGGSLGAVYTRDGFIYRLSVATGVETKLTDISLGGHNGFPTIQRGRIAFLHSGKGHSELRLYNTFSSSRKPKVLVKGTIDNVELGDTQLAYVIHDAKGPYGFGSSTVHVRNIATGHDNVVYRAVSGGANAAHVTKPSFTDDHKAFVWARTNNGSGKGNRIVKYTMRTGKLSYAAGTPRYASTAWAGGEFGAAYSTALEPYSNAGCEDAGKQYCSVGLTGPLNFNLKP